MDGKRQSIAGRPGWPLALVAAPGLLALLVEPLLWLVTTWTDPSWDSQGAWVAAACLGLMGRSIISGKACPCPQASRRAFMLLLVTAALRLAGRVLAINVIGALALVVDLYALALAMGTARRPWALSPGALALLFSFSLPLEQILQRLFGYPLRLLSSAAAHAVLAPLTEGLHRQGTLLVQPGLTLAIDLPCSGAQGLMLLATLAAAVACRRRLTLPQALLACLATLSGALIANTLRIVALFAGAKLALPVMEEPGHSALGLVALAIGALPLLSLAARWPQRAAILRPLAPRATIVSLKRALMPACLFSLAALAIAFAPAHPVDVSLPPRSQLSLPTYLDGKVGQRRAPSPQESAYFERFGGQVDKVAYTGADDITHTAVVVRTSAPLRHLHGPDRCLIGAGHRVERLGVRPGPLPTVVWRSTAPNGQAWRVEASFVSARGQRASTISEVVWLWMANPTTAWTLIERITPWPACEGRHDLCETFDRALFSALEAYPPQPQQEVY